MAPGQSFYDFRDTIAERWRAKLVGAGTKPRSHWATKVAHYRAVAEALASAPGRPITWREVIAATRPRGSASTFYDVAGRHAKHRLVDVYRNDRHANSLQIALEYRRTLAIDHLIDEAKVWSYWEYREAYLRTHLDADPLPTEAYLEALAAWASMNRPLAAAHDCAPPMCAVEDLVALHRGGLAALRARRMLTDVVREAVRRADPPLIAGPAVASDVPARTRAQESVHRIPSPRRSAEGSPTTEAADALSPDQAAGTAARVGS